MTPDYIKITDTLSEVTEKMQERAEQMGSAYFDDGLLQFIFSSISKELEMTAGELVNIQIQLIPLAIEQDERN